MPYLFGTNKHIYSTFYLIHIAFMVVRINHEGIKLLW